MKQIHFFWSALTIIIVAMIAMNIISCKKDEDENSTSQSAIVGSWRKYSEQEKKWEYKSGEWVLVKDEFEMSSGKSGYRFDADGTFCELYFNAQTNTWETSKKLSYRIDGNIIIFPTKQNTFSINGNYLDLIETEQSTSKKEEEIKRYIKI